MSFHFHPSGSVNLLPGINIPLKGHYVLVYAELTDIVIAAYYGHNDSKMFRSFETLPDLRSSLCPMVCSHSATTNAFAGKCKCRKRTVPVIEIRNAANPIQLYHIHTTIEAYDS